MKVKLLEHYRDSKVHFHPDQEVEVSAAMGAYLLEHRKAVEVIQAGSIHDVEPQFENANEPPIPPVRKTRKGRGAK